MLAEEGYGDNRSQIGESATGNNETAHSSTPFSVLHPSTSTTSAIAIADTSQIMATENTTTTATNITADEVIVEDDSIVAPLPSNYATVNETASAVADVWPADDHDDTHNPFFGLTQEEEADARIALALHQQELRELKLWGTHPHNGTAGAASSSSPAALGYEDAVAFVEDDDVDDNGESSMFLPRIAACIPGSASSSNMHDESTISNHRGAAAAAACFPSSTEDNSMQEAFVIESSPMMLGSNRIVPASVLHTEDDATNQGQPIQRRRRRTVTPDAIVEINDNDDESYHHQALFPTPFASLPPIAPVFQIQDESDVYDSKPPARVSEHHSAFPPPNAYHHQRHQQQRHQQQRYHHHLHRNHHQHLWSRRMGSIAENHENDFIASQPALVLGIQEDVHPAEDGQPEHASVAEWIGSSEPIVVDTSSATATMSYIESPSSLSSPTTPAVVIDSSVRNATGSSHPLLVASIATTLPFHDDASTPNATAAPFETESLVTASISTATFCTATTTTATSYELETTIPLFVPPPMPLSNPIRTDAHFATVTPNQSVSPPPMAVATLGEPIAAAVEEGGDDSNVPNIAEPYVDDEYILKLEAESVARAVPAEEPFVHQSRETSLEYLHASDREYQQNIASTVAESADQHTNSIRSQLNALASEGLHSVSQTIARGTSNALDHFFGDKHPTIPPLRQRRRSNSAGDLATSVATRTLLPWSVIRNPSTGLWIATLQTNQRALDSNNVTEASRSLRVFSMQTETQAICLSRAWTPPRMLNFSEHHNCHICKTKFTVLRRACTCCGGQQIHSHCKIAGHCRNCGVCICRDCAAQWPAKMVPETYNTKQEFFINVCKSCNWLCNSFRQALLEGDRDQAVALFSTGNVNLYTPFANVKGELFYPVHCAVLGNNCELLRFLVDEQCCPIKSVRINQGKGSRQSHTPIVTSRGRSLLGMAMEQGNMEIIQYLIVEKGVDSAAEPDVTRELLCSILTKALRRMPPIQQDATIMQEDSADAGFFPRGSNDLVLHEPQTPSVEQEQQRSISDGARDFGAVSVGSTNRRDFEGSVEECKSYCGQSFLCS